MGFRRVAGGLGAVLALGSAAVAAPAVVPTWAVDGTKSTLGFAGGRGGAPFTGRFRTWTASISFDPTHPETAQLLATVNVASAATGDARTDEVLQGEDGLDVSRFTTATFQATGFVPKGGDAYEAKGYLTLRGVTKPFDLPFTLTIAGNTAHALGRAKLVPTDFGAGRAPSASGDAAPPAVEVEVDLVATKTP